MKSMLNFYQQWVDDTKTIAALRHFGADHGYFKYLSLKYEFYIFCCNYLQVILYIRSYGFKVDKIETQYSYEEDKGFVYYDVTTLYFYA